jgi:hypothetical protein
LEKVAVILKELQDGERLAAIETKVDMIWEKINEKSGNDKAVDIRVRTLEVKTGIILTIGAGAWAIILILIGKVFGQWFGG